MRVNGECIAFGKNNAFEKDQTMVDRKQEVEQRESEEEKKRKE